MKNQKLPTYQFPLIIQNRYQSLMNSKESFLQNLTNAERRNLETLYEELESAWSQNHTEEQKIKISKSCEELKSLEKKLSKNWKEFEKEYEEELKESIANEEKNLIKKQKELDKDVQIWKDDTLEREKRIKQKKEELMTISMQFDTTYEQIMMSLSELKEESKALKKNKQPLEKKREELLRTVMKKKEEFLSRLKVKEKELLKRREDLEKKKIAFQNTLKEEEKSLSKESRKMKKDFEDWFGRTRVQEKNLSIVLDLEKRNLNKELEMLTKREVQYQTLGKKLKMTLEKDLKSLENKLLNQFKNELVNETTNLSESSKNLLRSEHYLEVLRLLKQTHQGSEELLKTLNSECESKGIDREQLLSKYDH